MSDNLEYPSFLLMFIQQYGALKGNLEVDFGMVGNKSTPMETMSNRY